MEKSAFFAEVSSPQESPKELYPAYITGRARFLLIHVFLPFVVYGKKRRMNGRSLIGAADDVILVLF